MSNKQVAPEVELHVREMFNLEIPDALFGIYYLRSHERVKREVDKLLYHPVLVMFLDTISLSKNVFKK